MSEKKKGTKLCTLGIVVLIITAAILLLVLVGTNNNYKGNFKDLGGARIVYEIADADKATEDEITDTLYKLNRRANNINNRSNVRKDGKNRIFVEVTDAESIDETLLTLGTKGSVSFVYAVDPSGNKNVNVDSVGNGTMLRLIEEIKKDGGVCVNGTMIIKAEATTGIVLDADSARQIIVRLTLTEEGREAFKEATKWASQQMNDASYIAVVFEDTLLKCIKVSEAVDSDTIEIYGFNDLEEAMKIADEIQIGEIPLDISVVDSYMVSPEGLSQTALTIILALGTLGCIVLIVLLFKVKKKRKAAQN